MPITFFKSANSVNKYINQKNPTQTDLAKAKDLLGKKIDHVLNKLQSHAHKRNIDITLISTGLRSNSDQMVKIDLSTGRLLANALIKITSHNTTAKDRAFTKEFSTLSMSLVKYSSQLEAIKNKEEISSILTKGKIAVPTPQQKALNNLKILINYVTPEDLKQEGIFRLDGASSDVKSLNKLLDKVDQNKTIKGLKETKCHHVIFSSLKNQFSLALSEQDKQNFIILLNHKKSEDKNTNNTPSKDNLPLPLQTLMPLLYRIIDNEDSNKMNAKNLAVCLSPNMIPSASNDEESLKLAKDIPPFLAQLITAEHEKNKAANTPMAVEATLKTAVAAFEDAKTAMEDYQAAQDSLKTAQTNFETAKRAFETKNTTEEASAAVLAAEAAFEEVVAAQNKSDTAEIIFEAASAAFQAAEATFEKSQQR